MTILSKNLTAVTLQFLSSHLETFLIKINSPLSFPASPFILYVLLIRYHKIDLSLTILLTIQTGLKGTNNNNHNLFDFLKLVQCGKSHLVLPLDHDYSQLCVCWLAPHNILMNVVINISKNNLGLSILLWGF